MPKTLRNVFDQKLTYLNLYNAYLRTYANKRNKKEIINYTIDLETNIIKLLDSLKKETYQIGRYYTFYVYEPKLRLIKALPFKDRIVHQWYIEEFIKPFIVKRFIKDSYACLNDKGNHKAIETLQFYMRLMKRKYGNYYVVKCDIKKFFYSIDKDKLYEIITKYLQDQKLLKLTKKFIYDDDLPKGIPIGNYTSQYFANIYLNELDHYVKDNLRIKYYLRYMDDFVLLVENKEKALMAFTKIKEFLKEVLLLELNHKSSYFPSHLGIDFCGYVVFATHILVRKRCKKLIKKRLKKWQEQFLQDNLDFHRVKLQLNSFKGHVSHANTYNLVNKIEKEYQNILMMKSSFNE